MAGMSVNGLKWRGRLWVVGLALSTLFLLAVTDGALAKVGLNLEWRPIEGLEQPPPKQEKPEEKPRDSDRQPSGKAGETRTFTVNGVSFKMVRIPAGEFLMGSPADEPERQGDETQHRVEISRDFWLGQTEVTQGLWKAVMGGNPSHFSNCGDDCPVEQVSWDDCQAFIGKLNGMVSGGGFGLPTEAEWEYACRAGTTTALYTGSIRIEGDNNSPDLDPIAWYGGNSCVNYDGGYDCSGWSGKQISCGRCGTHAVGKKKANGWGLYDTIGNVWEWCEDRYGDYPSGLVTDPEGPSGGSDRVVRGGGWLHGPRGCRSAGRGSCTPGYRDGDLGFRLARTR